MSCFYLASLASFFIFLIDHLFFTSFSDKIMISRIKHRSCMRTKHPIILIISPLFFFHRTFLFICFKIHKRASTTFICIPIILIISAQQTADIFSPVLKLLTGWIIILFINHAIWIHYIPLFVLR